MSNNNGRVLVEPIVVQTLNIKVTETVGPRGPQGIQGIQGIQGETGPPGPVETHLSTYINDVPFLELPADVSELTNDVGYITASSIDTLTNKTYEGFPIDDLYIQSAAIWNAKQNALGYTAENAAMKGAANGYCPLDVATKVPSIYLPSYVDDVLEYANLAAFPVTGSTGIIYIALDTNKEYRWSGSIYVELYDSPSSTDSLPEGSVNLYYTNARVLSYITGLNVSIFANDAGYVTPSSLATFTNKSGLISLWTNNAGYITASSSDALTNKTGNISQWTNNVPYLTSATAAASVSNSDSTLTISPTTGTVVASLNLNHANVWTQRQDMRLTTEQLRLAYDASNFVSFTVSSVGKLTLTGTAPQLLATGIGVNLDGQVVVLSLGQKGYVLVPYDATITGWSIISDLTGSCVFDVWKAAGAKPTVANTITASAKPTLTSNTFASSTTLTGWTTAITAGDVIGWNLDSASTVTWVILQLKLTKT